ncbi:MAG TPA: hypothetical protein VGK34_01650, partial [Armatimonadota bacterium]
MYKPNRANICTIAFILLFVCSIAIAPAFGGQGTASYRKTPVLLSGFEQADVLKCLSRLPCTLTSAHVSQGKSAVSFVLRKWQEGMPDDQKVTLGWNNGAGYSTKDWSGYNRIAFDAWVDEGHEACYMWVQVRDKLGKAVWSDGFQLMPGVKNPIELTLSDNSEILKDISEIEFGGNRQPYDYTITIDNLRLLPPVKPALADFDLVYPNYREIIFPNVNNIKVSAEVRPADYGLDPSTLLLKLTASGGKITCSSKSAVKDSVTAISLPIQKLPVGKVRLSAAVVSSKTGKTLSVKSWNLRKISRSETAAIPVYVDENNNSVVDGKPFFPLGWFGSGNPEHMSDIADSPFNCLLDYGTNLKPKAEMTAYLDAVQQKGLKLIYCLNDVYPTSTYFDDRTWEGVKGNDQIVSAVVNAYKDHPAILGWYLNDELSTALVPKLQDYYHRVRNTDPNHPCSIVLCIARDVKHFTSTTDILGFDTYPIPSEPITKVATGTQSLESASRGHMSYWMVLQAFAWYQHNSLDPDRSHTPTAEELKTGRAPTYEEGRCMTYLSLAHGAKGLLYWCYYDMKWLPQYKEMWGWMKSIGSEVKSLSPMLLSPDDLGEVKCS